MDTRHPSRTLLLILFMTVVTSSALVAQKSQVHWWRGTFDAAMKEAEMRNVPLLIALIQDGEEANERLIDDIFSQKAFVQVTEQTIPLIATKAEHGSKGQVIDGIEKEVCKRVGGCTCEQHQDNETRVFRHFFGNGESAKTPQVMICRPDLKLVERVIDVAGPRVYADAVKKARKQMGPGIDAKTYKGARSSLNKGRNLLRMKKYPEAWAELETLASIGGKSPLVREAMNLRRDIEQKVNETLSDAYKLADKGDYWNALIVLDQVARDFDGTPPAKPAVAAFKRLSKTKEGRIAARKLKKQQRYLPKMAKARAHEKRGEWGRARKEYRSIVSRAKGLPIAADAQARLDLFEKDDAIAAVLKSMDREEEAKKLLKEASAQSRSGDEKGARAILERIVRDYPGTRAAKTAKAKL